MSNYAVVFPGQGSQSIGMLSELSEKTPGMKIIFTEASEVLGYDLWDLCQTNPEEKLNQTLYTQPAMLAADIAVWTAWLASSNEDPEFVAGHSLGEYAALVAAGSIDYKSAIRLVQKRAELMQSAVPEGKGAMASIIRLDNDIIVDICKEVAEGEVLAPANFNSIGQTVIAGEKSAVMRAVEMAKEKGAKKVVVLPVSIPSHCPLMQPAADEFAKVLAEIDFKVPKIKMIHNFDLQSHDNADDIRNALVQQLTHPVRWVETIQKIVGAGIVNLLECGPGKVLAGLNKRVDASVTTSLTFKPDNFDAAVEILN